MGLGKREQREQELVKLLEKKCIDPRKIDVDNIVNEVIKELAATKKE